MSALVEVAKVTGLGIETEDAATSRSVKGPVGRFSMPMERAERRKTAEFEVSENKVEIGTHLASSLNAKPAVLILYPNRCNHDL
jgi:hypothetical protein